MTALITILKNSLGLNNFSIQEAHPQLGKDFIETLFSKDPGNYTGFYVAISVHHPHPFYKPSDLQQKGWQKFSIEPTATSINLFKFVTPKNTRNNKDSFHGVNSNLPDHANRITAPAPVIKTINILKTSLEKIFDDNIPAGQKIDFLSIDADGFDTESLKHNNWRKYTPSFIIVKANETAVSHISDFLTHKNYALIAQTNGTWVFNLKGIK